MKAIISSTYDDMYLFFLPLVTWSWNKIGVEVICFAQHKVRSTETLNKANRLLAFMNEQGLRFRVEYFRATDEKEATYAQCSRLYASALGYLDENEVLITGDVDMAVFGDYLKQAESGQIHIFGFDLVPPEQYPICYIAMPCKTWREVMWITPGVPVQQYLDELLGHLECDHFRGNYWGKDQETIYNQLTRDRWPGVLHKRANGPHQFATRRADRDGWPDGPPPGIIDAHLPRPGYTDGNWSKIFNLFKQIYPDENLQWMEDYRNQYIKLL